MKKIYYLMGKSSSGKDTLYEKLIADRSLKLRALVPYTTRPIREHEKEGETYHFVTMEELLSFRERGCVIEERCYQTIYGPWYYFTADDGEILQSPDSYLAIGTLDSYRNLREYFGSSVLFPLYIEVEDGKRLIRAILREMEQEKPKYEEMCRRFLADAADFSEERLNESGITERYSNNGTLEECLEQLRRVIRNNLKV